METVKVNDPSVSQSDGQLVIPTDAQMEWKNAIMPESHGFLVIVF